jgi:trans-aconitate 2-methyltransferase
MPQDAWNPQQYERFKDERSQPFYDLLALVQPAAGGCAVDLGCGTGELTAVLHRHVQARETVGIDHSANMLEKSQAILVRPRVVELRQQALAIAFQKAIEQLGGQLALVDKR